MFGRQWGGHHGQHHVVEVSIMGCAGLGSC